MDKLELTEELVGAMPVGTALTEPHTRRDIVVARLAGDRWIVSCVPGSSALAWQPRDIMHYVALYRKIADSK